MTGGSPRGTWDDASARADDRTTVDLRDMLQILRERYLIVLVSTVLALALGFAYLATAPRIYTGVTSILIDTRVRSAVGDPNNNLGGSPDAILVESQVRLISSEPVLRRVVEAEDLADDPEFVSQGVGLRTRLMNALGLGHPAEPSAVDKATRAVLSLAPRVVVKRSERTYIADIEVTSTDPVKAAALANAVARAYLEDQQAARNDAAERDSGWVHDQVSAMQTGLQDAERKVDAYRREHGLLNANGKPVNEQELEDAVKALSDAKAATTEVKARYEQIHKAILAGRKAGSLPDALKSPAIERLRAQLADISRQQASLRQTLGDRHPALLESEQQMRDVHRLIGEELDRVEAGIANELQTAQSNVVGLEAHVQALRQVTVTSNESHVKLDELQRDVDARRAVYDRFLRARDTVREQTVDAPIGRIIAPAMAPTAATSPKTFAVLVLSLAVGLAAGIGGALVYDLMTETRSPLPLFRRQGRHARVSPDAPEPIVAEPLVPVLGELPSPFGAVARFETDAWRLDRLRAAWPTSFEVDHRALDANFLKAVDRLDLGPPPPEAAPGRTVLLTSVRPFPSRTTLALALGQRAAAAGLRALVIDADGSADLMRDLVVPGARPALLDLSGTTRLCYRVMLPTAGSLSIVPVMADEARLARRLAGRPETRRLDRIADYFDFVIFDGPMVGQMDRLNTVTASTDTILVVAPLSATQADIDRAGTLFDVPPHCGIAAVIAEHLAEPLRSSEAA